MIQGIERSEGHQKAQHCGVRLKVLSASMAAPNMDTRAFVFCLPPGFKLGEAGNELYRDFLRGIGPLQRVQSLRPGFAELEPGTH